MNILRPFKQPLLSEEDGSGIYFDVETNPETKSQTIGLAETVDGLMTKAIDNGLHKSDAAMILRVLADELENNNEGNQ